MADVKTTLSLEDQITPKLKKIYTGMEKLEKYLGEISGKGNSQPLKFASNTLEALEGNVLRLDDIIKENTNNANKWKNEFVDMAQVITGINQATEIFNKVTNTMSRVAAYSDELVLLKARLDLITETKEETNALQSNIYRASQQARSSYTAMANTVAQLGLLAKDAFSNTSEITDFAESLNKIFKISGLNDEAVSSVMYNLTQSLASGRLLGQDYRIIKQNGAKLINYLKSYYGVTAKELDKMVENGQVSSEDIKNAVLSQVDEINAQFNTLPITFEAAMQRLTNTNDFYFTKINEKISKVFNSGLGQQLIRDINSYLVGIYTSTDLALTAIEKLASLSNEVSFTDNFTLGDTFSTLGQQGIVALEAIGAAIGINLIARLIEFGKVQLKALGSFISNLNVAERRTVSLATATAGLLVGLVGGYNILEQQAEKSGATARDFFAFMFAGFGAIKTAAINLGIDLLNFGIWVANGIGSAFSWVLDKFGIDMGFEKQDYFDRLNYREEALKDVEKGYKAYDFLFGGNSETILDEGIDNSLKNIEEAVTGSGIKIAEEDLQLLKNVAATEFVNRYTTLRPSMEVSFGDVRETADVNALQERIAEMMENALAESLY